MFPEKVTSMLSEPCTPAKNNGSQLADSQTQGWGCRASLQGISP